jgi:succinoglycan biosynthesis transport protein ExoP
MAEDFEEQSPGGGFDLEHYMGIVRRRHMQFLIPLFVGWALVWGVSWVLPPRYLSNTLILVEQPTMPKDYVTPNVNDDLQERMQSITQQILSRTRLLHIIDQFGLYANQHSQPSPDQKVQLMRKDIAIDLVRDNGNQITAFNVSYTSRDPQVAQKVTSELTNLFINENLEVRQQQSEDTTKFLEGQLETARKTLSDQEEKIREFKGQHVGELPTQVGSNLQILSGLQSQLQTEEDALNTAKQQRVYLETLVNQYRSLQGSSQGSKSESGGAPVGLPAIDEELDKLRAQLADLSSHYTDRHPDVRKVKEQIAKTEKMRDQLVASLKAKAAAAQADPSAASSEATDAQNLSSPMAQLQGQVQSNRVEIANRERSVTDLQAKVVDYQGRLNQEPVREQQLADLTRGYEQSKANYDDLLKKKNESAMATSMELLQQGERFRVIDAPSLPIKPDFPNRLKFCAIGLGIGLALGVVVAGAFEFMDERIYDEKELQKLLPVPVISEIPALAEPADLQMEHRRLWLGWVTAAFVSATILLGSALSYLRG